MSFAKALWFLSDLHAALSEGFALAAGMVDEKQPVGEQQGK